MERLDLGIITKPQALKGAFRVKPNILNLKKFKKLNEIFINNVSYKIETVTLRDTFVILKVVGIDTCEQAEILRNYHVLGDLEIEKDNNFDLIGYECIVDDKHGKILDINNFGSKDIMTIEFEKECLVPVIDGLISRVDNQNKVVIFNKQIFEQVAVLWE